MIDQMTPRHELPLLAAGQAQKEMTVNEALSVIDHLLHPCAEAAGSEVPPDLALPGQCWLIGDAPTGAWAGWPRHLGCWTTGGWRFVAPREGMRVWIGAEQMYAVFRSGAWSVGVLTASVITIGGQQVVGPRRAAIPAPSGGATIDLEARAAVDAIRAALAGHGLIQGGAPSL